MNTEQVVVRLRVERLGHITCSFDVDWDNIRSDDSKLVGQCMKGVHEVLKDYRYRKQDRETLLRMKAHITDELSYWLFGVLSFEVFLDS